MLAFLAAAFSLLPQSPLAVDVTPKGKEPLRASWTIGSIALEADFGSVSIKAAHLARIEFGQPDLVVTDGGTELRGEVKLRQFEFKIDGKARRFAATELASIGVVRDGKALGVADFGGEWMSSFGPMNLTQRGTKVKGDYAFGSGTLEGVAKDGVLTFAYRSDGGAGDGTFTLDAERGLLLGSYKDNSKSDGAWAAYRKVAATPALQPGVVVEGQTKAGLRFHARAPKAHAADKKWPAICMLHGSNMTARAYVDTIVATWPDLAEQYLVVGFDGERINGDSKPGELTFNYTYINFSGPDQGPAWMSRQSPALVAESLDQLGKELPVTKWFLGGHSQGGFLTWCLVMYYPQLLAGAFPMSCNLLVQCEPDEFDAARAARQHEVAVAVIHGKADNVVAFSGGAYEHLRALDGGFPFVRLFAPANVGHQFAWLPVKDAVQWLAACADDDVGALLTFAEARAKESAWRDVGALLQRVAARKPDAAQSGRAQQLQQQLAAAAAPAAKKLAEAIGKDRDGRWADDFLAFRQDFATAEAAAPALTAYAALRQKQKDRGDELFGKARRAGDKTEREAIYRELLKTCYATKWYAAVKLWLE